MNKKLEALQEYLKELGSVAIAFSSGVDSTFLLKVAHDVLGDQVIAVTAQSCSFPKRELEEAKAFCKKEGIKHIICESEELLKKTCNCISPHQCPFIFHQVTQTAQASSGSSYAECICCLNTYQFCFIIRQIIKKSFILRRVPANQNFCCRPPDILFSAFETFS